MLIKTRMSLQIQSFFYYFTFVEHGDEMKEDSETDEEFKNLEKSAARGKKKKIRNEKSSFHEQVIALQKESLELQKQQDERQHQLIRDILEEQRKTDTEERERDRDFFLKLGAMLSGNNNEKK